MTTPAQKAGFIIGNVYEVASRGGFDFEAGDQIRFTDDDGTDMPGFRRTFDDKFQYVHLPHLVQPAKLKEELVNYIIDVTNAETTVKVGKILSADQIKRIIEVMGE